MVTNGLMLRTDGERKRERKKLRRGQAATRANVWLGRGRNE